MQFSLLLLLVSVLSSLLVAALVTPQHRLYQPVDFNHQLHPNQPPANHSPQHNYYYQQPRYNYKSYGVAEYEPKQVSSGLLGEGVQAVSSEFLPGMTMMMRKPKVMTLRQYTTVYINGHPKGSLVTVPINDALYNYPDNHSERLQFKRWPYQRLPSDPIDIAIYYKTSVPRFLNVAVLSRHNHHRAHHPLAMTSVYVLPIHHRVTVRLQPANSVINHEHLKLHACLTHRPLQFARGVTHHVRGINRHVKIRLGRVMADQSLHSRPVVVNSIDDGEKEGESSWESEESQTGSETVGEGETPVPGSTPSEGPASQPSSTETEQTKQPASPTQETELQPDEATDTSGEANKDTTTGCSGNDSCSASDRDSAADSNNNQYKDDTLTGSCSSTSSSGNNKGEEEVKQSLLTRSSRAADKIEPILSQLQHHFHDRPTDQANNQPTQQQLITLQQPIQEQNTSSFVPHDNSILAHFEIQHNATIHDSDQNHTLISTSNQQTTERESESTQSTLNPPSVSVSASINTDAFEKDIFPQQLAVWFESTSDASEEAEADSMNDIVKLPMQNSMSLQSRPLNALPFEDMVAESQLIRTHSGLAASASVAAVSKSPPVVEHHRYAAAQNQLKFRASEQFTAINNPINAHLYREPVQQQQQVTEKPEPAVLSVIFITAAIILSALLVLFLLYRVYQLVRNKRTLHQQIYKLRQRQNDQMQQPV